MLTSHRTRRMMVLIYEPTRFVPIYLTAPFPSSPSQRNILVTCHISCHMKDRVADRRSLRATGPLTAL